MRAAIDEATAVLAAQREADLVTGEPADDRHHDHQREVQVPFMRGEAGEDEHHLSFEDGPDEHGGVAEGGEDGGEVHVAVGPDRAAGRGA